MGRDEILERINEIIQEISDDDVVEIFEDTTADDIEQWESLILEIEGEYGFKFKQKDLENVESIGEIIDIVLENV